MEPTWGQHGVQEKRQDRSQGPRNLILRGSEAKIADRSQHGPKMDPKMDTRWTKMHPQTYPEWIPNQFPSRLQMDHPSTPKSTPKALSHPFPDPTIHELSGRVGSCPCKPPSHPNIQPRIRKHPTTNTTIYPDGLAAEGKALSIKSQNVRTSRRLT